MSFEDYRATQVPPQRRNPINKKPWAPFRTRLDFEIAEFVQDAMLNKNQINVLLSLIQRCSKNPEGWTLQNQADLKKQWTFASEICTEFQQFEVTVPYKQEERKFEMYARPLWRWAMDIVQDPHLADFFVWDAEQCYLFDGQKWKRFYTEPWTAAAMWDIQSIDNKLLPCIIYADKAKLSSFGTQKGYPVIARLANMVVSIRNSSDWGGGQIVGWLPVVDEDPAETKKPGYVNFKNAVWHEAFYKLLETIVAASKTGHATECGDGMLRILYPMILILAADYEEVCVMALIRGLRALYPCPICYVKNEDQPDLSKKADLHTSKLSQDIVAEARTMTAEGRDNLLQSHGLRNVDNVFWNVAYSDPHQALSFEHLHSYSSGLWGRHLFSSFPRWRNLNHFDSVMSTAFNDATKHEDIAKMIVLTAHNILERPIDQLLLQLCRCYQELSFKTPGLEEKKWNFPKVHAHQHVFDDIRRKGVSRNFGAKIDEAVHGPVRQTYQRQMNFKNIATQILKSDHRTMVGKRIRDQINDLDGIARREWEALTAPTALNQEADEEDGNSPGDLSEKIDNVALGSKLPPISFEELEQKMKADTAFHRFRLKFSEFFASFLYVYEGQLPGGQPVNFKSTDQIMPYRFLKIFYQSLNDWSDEADYLHCHPNFHKHPRFDGALLIHVFEVLANGKTYPFALVQPLDSPVGQIPAKDKALKLFRARAKPRQASEFIPVRSIIRGAVLVPDSEKHRDFIVMDVVDGDMFLRLQDMYRARFE
ncbi:hypothetical protein K438DRAFT_1906569 [Mycena galopus ATCC 62051]|nr:hypothetical protein K438DRAFT_1906569 [Mycena galopus ATCC 62051]